VRTGITVAIIAFGIMALVGINTAIEAMKQKFTDSFSSMGATGFSIRFREPRIRIGGGNNELKKEKKGQKKEKKSSMGKPITKQQAEEFKRQYNFPAKVSLYIFGTSNAVISTGNKKSNPTVRVFGGDENFIEQNGYTINTGRSLNSLDIETGRNVALIGSEVAKRFFGENAERPLDKIIKVNNIPFRVVGVMKEKGSAMGFSWDNTIVTSYNNVRRFFNSNPNSTFTIQIKVPDVKLMDGAISQATGMFRPIRSLTTTEDDNFTIDKSDTIVQMLMDFFSYFTISAIVIGIITLAGAAVGLMNIMLVAVTERTKEVGLIKAIGGRNRNVRTQILFEAIIISLLGAMFGVVLGVLLGNIFSMVLNTSFVVPWNWVILGIIICSFVGLFAGLYPAIKAGRLNPIEALRYE
jgi:putative ABC transport system permease protein